MQQPVFVARRDQCPAAEQAISGAGLLYADGADVIQTLCKRRGEGRGHVLYDHDRRTIEWKGFENGFQSVHPASRELHRSVFCARCAPWLETGAAP